MNLLFAGSGYIGLFFSSFLAATIIPFSSEAMLLLSIEHFGNWPLPLFVASTGNILGSMVNYGLGYKGKNLILNRWMRMDDTAIEKAASMYNRYGLFSLLFAWVPVVGDPLTVAAGIFRTNYFLFLLLVSIGKTGRYFFIIYAWYYFQ